MLCNTFAFYIWHAKQSLLRRTLIINHIDKTTKALSLSAFVILRSMNFLNVQRFNDCIHVIKELELIQLEIITFNQKNNILKHNVSHMDRTNTIFEKLKMNDRFHLSLDLFNFLWNALYRKTQIILKRIIDISANRENWVITFGTSHWLWHSRKHSIWLIAAFMKKFVHLGISQQENNKPQKISLTYDDICLTKKEKLFCYHIRAKVYVIRLHGYIINPFTR